MKPRRLGFHGLEGLISPPIIVRFLELIQINGKSHLKPICSYVLFRFSNDTEEALFMATH